MSVQALLDFIAGPESGGDYNIVWGGIKTKDRPPKPLTQMTVGEVLAWQDRIDPYYMSEAAGKYQIMEDTLRGLYREAGVPLTALFNKATQDKLAAALLERRGLSDYLSGSLSAEKFANALAKEWAGLPVVSGPRRGRSYYGGDGLNASHVGVDEFMDAVKATTGTARARPPETIPQRVATKSKRAAPAAGAGISGALAVAVDAAPAARMLGGFAPTAQLVAVICAALCVGFILYQQTKD